MPQRKRGRKCKREVELWGGLAYAQGWELSLRWLSLLLSCSSPNLLLSALFLIPTSLYFVTFNGIFPVSRFLFCHSTRIISILQVSAQIPLNSSNNIFYVLTLGPGTADTDPERVLILMQLILIIWRGSRQPVYVNT